MPTFKIEIEYEGTRYRGWLREHLQKTIQGELMQAARQMFSVKPEIFAAEDTETGVHAYANTAHLKLSELNADVTPSQIQQRFNDNLPHDINIKKLRNAPENFHARNDAAGKVYLYQMATRRTAFAKNFVWWLKDNSNLDEMVEAAEILVGKHDLGSFCDADESGKTSFPLDVYRSEIFADGDLICYRIAADRFSPKMVQRIVGVLAEIGRKKYSVTDFGRLIKFKSNAAKTFTAPPSGLFLEKILYKGDEVSERQDAIISI